MATEAQEKARIHHDLHLPFEPTQEHYELVNVVAMRFWQHVEPYTFTQFLSKFSSEQPLQLSEQDENYVFDTIKRLQKQDGPHIPAYKHLYLFADTLYTEFDDQTREDMIATFITDSLNNQAIRRTVLVTSSSRPELSQQSSK